ncbi:MAG TPA: hypothetical protein VMU33_10565 [Burkholderiaceae bacterium]|nr:hypothetical protein [Burkholderiaceae bacterium]
MKAGVALALGLVVAPAVMADEFPTSDRVEYVLECMYRHGGAQALLYKCSCAIDNIAKQYSYDDYVAASTTTRSQGLPADQGGVFRDDAGNRQIATKYRKVQDDALRACGVVTR